MRLVCSLLLRAAGYVTRVFPLPRKRCRVNLCRPSFVCSSIAAGHERARAARAARRARAGDRNHCTATSRAPRGVLQVVDWKSRSTTTNCASALAVAGVIGQQAPRRSAGAKRCLRAIDANARSDKIVGDCTIAKSPWTRISRASPPRVVARMSWRLQARRLADLLRFRHALPQEPRPQAGPCSYT